MKNQNPGWQTAALYVLFGVVVAGGLATLIGAGAVRLACGTGGRPNSVFAGLQLAFGGSAAGFTTAAGCAPPVTMARVLDVLAVVLLLAIAAAIAAWWFRFQRSDRRLVRELRMRSGLARPREVRTRASARAVLAQARAVRPGLADQTPGAAGWRVGVAHDQEVYVSIEDALVVAGALRGGAEQRFVADAILDWCGPLVTTSTRSDSLATTMRERARLGEVMVFDPQGLSGTRSPLRISPVAGCSDPLVAEQRGRAIVVGAGPWGSGTNADGARVASSVLARLLHAAAVSDQGADALARWGANPRLASEAVRVLAEQGTPGWADDLDAIINGDQKMLASSWVGVSAAVRPLEIPAIRKAMTPGFGEQFDADRFLAGSNSLYLIGTGVGAGSTGGFLAAVVDDVAETARHKALGSSGSRLEPPLALILDEVASMFSWPALPRIMADGPGLGISTVAVLHPFAEAETVWSRAETDAVWSAGIAKLLFGGAADLDRLRDVEALLGTRRVRTERAPVVSLDELRQLPETVGILAYRARRGIFLDVRGRPHRRDTAEIMESQHAAELDQRVVFAEQYRAALDRRHTAGRN